MYDTQLGSLHIEQRVNLFCRELRNADHQVRPLRRVAGLLREPLPELCR